MCQRLRHKFEGIRNDLSLSLLLLLPLPFLSLPSLSLPFLSLYGHFQTLRSLLQTFITFNRKAMAVTDFPSEAVINEYLISKDKLPKNCRELLTWQFPRSISSQVVCHRLLEWPFEYTHEKVLPLMAQWVIRERGMADGAGSQDQLAPSR